MRSVRVSALRRELLGWFRGHRRDYPWRRSRDSYAIWVSEVMLQQTRIAVVIPAYQRFLEALPTLAALAAASEERVLSLWSGLGYYTRARALHAAARVLVQRGEKELPHAYDEARKLPGVGPYTAAAVLSIAYQQPHAAVDGNILRVLSRLECVSTPGARGEPYTALAQRLLEPSAPGDWNQALMELGQSICLPKSPRCELCPWRRLCRAKRLDRIADFPPRRQRPARLQLPLELTLVRDTAGRLLLERGTFAHLPHLWLPLVGCLPGSSPLGDLRHAIVHRDFNVRLFAKKVTSGALQRLAKVRGTERRILTAAELGSIGRSSLLTKSLALCARPTLPKPHSCDGA